jgi:hypothetical protein
MMRQSDMWPGHRAYRFHAVGKNSQKYICMVNNDEITLLKDGTDPHHPCTFPKHSNPASLEKNLITS